MEKNLKPISKNNSATFVPNSLFQNEKSVTNPIKIANISNSFFSTIAATTNSKNEFLHQL